jgi:hypothetical protein
VIPNQEMQSLPAYHIGSYKTSFILCSTQEGHISSANVTEQEGRGADEDISFFHELVKIVTKRHNKVRTVYTSKSSSFFIQNMNRKRIQVLT